MKKEEDKPKVISADAPGAPPSAKVMQAVVQMGVSSVEMGVLTPAEFALALGLSLSAFSRLVAEHTGKPADEVLKALRENIDRGMNIPVVRTEERPDEAAPPPSSGVASGGEERIAVADIPDNPYGIDLASVEPANGMIH